MELYVNEKQDYFLTDSSQYRTWFSLFFFLWCRTSFYLKQYLI